VKNLVHQHVSSPVNEVEYSAYFNSRNARLMPQRASRVPRLPTSIVSVIRRNWALNLNHAAVLAVMAASFVLGYPVPTAHSQIAVGIGIEPTMCQYGYYDYSPYSCAPEGFYGPEFFFGGHFRGAGPWEGRGRGYNVKKEPQFRQAHAQADKHGGMENRGHPSQEKTDGNHR